MPSRRSPVAALFSVAIFLAGCVATPSSAPNSSAPPAFDALGRDPALTPEMFLSVVRNVEPVAEAACRSETPDQNCDFAILLDRDPRVGANAFHTVDRTGRPLIIMTLPLIAFLESEDELAFVLGHEAGHHIARHLPLQRQSAAEGARVFGELAIASGATGRNVERAARIGAEVGARTYSRSAELEADAIGTAIAFRAGYDPRGGAALFTRLPDPGMRYLSTHPPNAERLAVIRRTLAALQSGG